MRRAGLSAPAELLVLLSHRFTITAWIVSAPTVHSIMCILNYCLQWFKVSLRTLATADSCLTYLGSTTAPLSRQASCERTSNCADSATYEVTDPEPEP